LVSSSLNNLNVSGNSVVNDLTINGTLNYNLESSPTGTISYYSKNDPPSGWLSCDGSYLNINEYTSLYNVIGSTFNPPTFEDNTIHTNNKSNFLPNNSKMVSVSKDGKVIILSNNTSKENYVFFKTTNTSSTWTQGTIIDNTPSNDKTSTYGSLNSINSNGDYISVSDYDWNSIRGRVYIYKRGVGDNINTWSLIQTLTSIDPAANRYFGIYSKFNSNASKLVIGESGFDSYRGRVLIYTLNNNQYTHSETIIGASTFSSFGVSFDFNDDVSAIAIGAPDLTSSTGRVYITKKENGSWNNINNFSIVESNLGTVSNQNSRFGSSIACSADMSRIFITKVYTATGPQNNRVYIVNLPSSLNTLVGSTSTFLTFESPSENNVLSSSSKLLSTNESGNNLLVGTPLYKNSSNSSFTNGRAVLFKLSGTSWVRVRTFNHNESTINYFNAESVSMSNDLSTIIISGDRQNTTINQFPIYYTAVTFGIPDLRGAFIRSWINNKPSIMTTLQKFGELLPASTIQDNTNGTNNQPDVNIYANGDMIDTDNLPIGSHGSNRPATQPSGGRRLHVRPYNIALLPIIKF
jgi:hypothetical protein